MAEQMRPASAKQAPDPANSYERSKPQNEPGMGRLDQDEPRPQDNPDQMTDAVKQKQANRQVNASDPVNQRGGPTPETGKKEE
jgi:hypothetical protein